MPEFLKSSHPSGPAAKRIRQIRLISVRQLLFWVFIFILTRFFMSGADHFLKLTPEALGKYFTLRWVLIAHITGGGGALILGPLQFWNRFRARYSKLHRFEDISPTLFWMGWSVPLFVYQVILSWKTQPC
jgi:hypothetical protein